MTPDQIKDARQSLGLSQEDMARMMGYRSKSRLSEIERGKKPISDAATRLLAAYMSGYRPEDWPKTEKGK